MNDSATADYVESLQVRSQNSNAPVARPSLGSSLWNVARRLIFPRHLYALSRLMRAGTDRRKSAHDAELRFCADVLPGGFLNYGFFEDASLPPEAISLTSIQQAQTAYAKLLTGLVHDKQRPVLDVGCGMGGLLKLLVADGFNVTGLTPNEAQITHIRGCLPAVPLLTGRFDLKTLSEHRARFGTVITSESFQYVRLARGMETMRHVLAPGGRWVLCDYFRVAETRRKSGHQWTEFQRTLVEHGFRIVSERDITANVLPTLRYLHMLGSRVGDAALQFGIGKLQCKSPALHYVLADSIADWRAFLSDQVRTVDPDIFVREKKYILLVIERAAK